MIGIGGDWTAHTTANCRLGFVRSPANVVSQIRRTSCSALPGDTSAGLITWTGERAAEVVFNPTFNPDRLNIDRLVIGFAGQSDAWAALLAFSCAALEASSLTLSLGV
jgi:hypothetical protein